MDFHLFIMQIRLLFFYLLLRLYAFQVRDLVDLQDLILIVEVVIEQVNVLSAVVFGREFDDCCWLCFLGFSGFLV